MIKKKIVIKGSKVKNVVYRPFLLDTADSELLPHFDAKNKDGLDKDGNETVEVFVGGEEREVDNFIKFIKEKNNRPKNAKVESIEVVDEDYKGNIRTTESFSRWLSNDQLYKFAEIGTMMLGKQNDTINEIGKLRSETSEHFEKLDMKYELISKGMFAVVEELKTTNKILGERIEKIDERIEKTDKNIERLLDILVEEKKKIPEI